MQTDVAVLGGGMAGMATALRLQARGVRTVLLEAHGHAGGCAGYWRHRGFSFDVGATTLVDFEPGGVGAELLDSVGMGPVIGEALPGYQAWLPDRTVRLHRDQAAWHAERLRAFGDDEAHRRFWRFLDTVSDGFWRASRSGVRLPLRHPADLLANARAIGLRHAPLARHLNATLGGALRRHGLRGDAALCGLLGMLVEDTVHSDLDDAPLINAALGVTIRGAGLTRHEGGMHGLWRRLVTHYRSLGGELRTASLVTGVEGRAGAFTVRTARATIGARCVVSALPAESTSTIFGGTVARRLAPFLARDTQRLGGAIVVFLGVPDSDVSGPDLTHHQLLQDYAAPLGDGNNMFVSVSAPGDLLSAPAGHRAVMISTHTSLATWSGLTPEEHTLHRTEIGERLLGLARRAYPRLGEAPLVESTATPRAFARYAFRPHGAVGGVRQTPRHTNLHAIPHDLGVPGVRLVGDSTWPGLGTVACVIGSRIVADDIRRELRRAR
ncbi:phytoene dehydrogenase-like protein [Allocatelliglobosispora scoriae]|uniref:Phytoene dehydrogenase-like protein n=1 Tax=Allocatelliglobosispora scoriae TaxID=643052 RepID=A0A841BZE8_9ACTN|nr:NAD(P)/FAD-dependent oxidoreductase [Allocatelliglobosispora scoriae]MBB5872868.1 phytoene dehydrogenase-like protein [Allocatelliglobosispora scoriae]